MLFASFPRLRFATLLMSAVLVATTTACNRDKDQAAPDPTEELRTNSADQATAENDDANVAETLELDAPAPAEMGRPLPADSAASGFALPGRTGCATRSWDVATKTLTVDFGSANCLCRDGRYRRGVLRAQFTGGRYTPGSTVTISRENYFVDDNQHLGTRVLTYTDYNTWDVAVTNAQVLFANNGGTVSWASQRHVTRTAAPGTPTTFTVTGQGSGINRRGVAYTAQIQAPLVKRRELGCAGVFLDGTVLLTRANGRTALFNYNPAGVSPAPCDRLAAVTVGEITRQITLR